MIYFLISIFIIFYSCQSTNNNIPKEIANKNEYAKNFSVTYKNNIPIIKIYNFYQGAKNETLTYDLSQLKIKIPIKRAVILSTTYIGYLELLNEISSIKGVSGSEYIYNANILSKIDKKEIKDIGYEQNINYEALLQTKPDVVFAYAVTKESLPYLKKIQNLGIPVFYTAEYLENHPLGRLEWIKFFAVFYNKQKLADSIFKTITALYNETKQKANSIKNKPLVLLNFPFNGIWYMPGKNSYFIKLIEDAGGKYIFDTLTSKEVYPMTQENVIYHSINADIWLNINNFNKINEIHLNGIENIKAFKTKRLYNNNKQVNSKGANKFWENGAVEPHIILNDLFKIFQNLDSNNTYYYKKIQ